MFITFEGIEGCGKSTQSKMLSEKLTLNGIPNILTREPGGCESAEKIRSIILDKNTSLFAETELLLFYAARIEHINAVVKPALNSGKTVICDRFYDSTIAYQAYARKLGLPYVMQLHNLLLGNFRPDITFLLDIDVTIAFERVRSRRQAEDRIEQEPESFHQSVRDGFLKLASAEPLRIIKINAMASADNIAEEVSEIISA